MFKKYILSLILAIISIFSICMINCSSNIVFAEDVKNLKGDSYILVEATSKKILTSKNETKRLPVASICKLMTSLLVMEGIDNGDISLDDKVQVSEHASSMEGSQAFLDAGSEYSVKDLLKSVIIASANDSSVALAEYIAGSENDFVAMMNKKAQELNMSDTIYANATGLNSIGQHSTAKDTAIVLFEVNKFDIYHKYCKIWMDKLKHPSGRVTDLVNTNRLVKYYNKCVSGKTGYTDEAGYCLSSVAKNNNMELIAVTLGCNVPNERFEDCVKLFNWGFSNFKSTKLVDSTISKKIKINKAKEEFVDVVPKKDFIAVVKNGNNFDYNIDYKFDVVSAPIKKGDIVGKIIITDINSEVVEIIDIVSNSYINRENLLDIFEKLFNNWQLS